MSQQTQATLILSFHLPHKILVADDSLFYVLGHQAEEIRGRDIFVLCGPSTDIFKLCSCIRESVQAVTCQASILLYSSSGQPRMVILQASPFCDTLGRVCACVLRASLACPIQPLPGPSFGTDYISNLLQIVDAASSISHDASICTFARRQLPFSQLPLGAPQRPSIDSSPFQKFTPAAAAASNARPGFLADIPFLPSLLALLPAPHPAAAFSSLAAAADALRLPLPRLHDSDAWVAPVLLPTPSAIPRPAALGDCRPRCSPGHASGPRSRCGASSESAVAVGSDSESPRGRASPSAACGSPPADRRGGGRPPQQRGVRSGKMAAAAAVRLVDEAYVRRLRRRYRATDRRDAAAAAAAAAKAAGTAVAAPTAPTTSSGRA